MPRTRQIIDLLPEDNNKINIPQTIKAIRDYKPPPEKSELDLLLESPDEDVLESGIFYDGDRHVSGNHFRRRKRTPAERESDLIEMIPLYLKGATHHQLAEHISNIRSYSLSRQQVYRDIIEIYKRWKVAYLKGINELKVRELAKLDRLENEYWDAWDRSRKDFLSVRQDKTIDETSRKTKVTTDKNGNITEEEEETTLKPVHSRTKTQTKKEERDGNVAYLQGIERCINKRCEILGLDSARNININWRNQAKAVGLDPEEIINGIEERLLASMDGSRLSGSLGSGE